MGGIVADLAGSIGWEQSNCKKMAPGLIIQEKHNNKIIQIEYRLLTNNAMAFN